MKRLGLPALSIGIVAALGARGAAAATDCASLPTPVYATGSTAAKPLLAEIGKLMAGQSPPVTVVYLGQGSCAGVDAILSLTTLMGSGATAPSYWDATGAELNCDITAPVGVVANIGISDVFANSCFQLSGGLPTSVAEYLGPVQAMTFVTNKSSTERAISAEAAYNIYGFGAGATGARRPQARFAEFVARLQRVKMRGAKRAARVSACRGSRCAAARATPRAAGPGRACRSSRA
jgi:hypothetical protein